MNQMIFTQFSAGDLKDLIKEAVKESLTSQNDYTPNEERLFDLSEAAQFLKIAEQTLYSYTSRRKIPFLKKSKKLYFRKSELETWIISGRKQTLDELKQAASEILTNQLKKGGKR